MSTMPGAHLLSRWVHSWLAAWLAVWVGTALPASAGIISHDPAEACIWVRGFPEDAPATLDDLLLADRTNGWGLVQYDPANDTYAVKASLFIGSDRDLGTYLQLGRADHPRETVIVQGDVWIKPPRESVKRPDGKDSICNRLTLGNATNASIRAMLKIACSKPNEFGLFIGLRQDPVWISRGDLYVFHSTITAARPDDAHILRGSGNCRGMSVGWYASDVRLKHATLSWISGAMMYGVNSQNAQIEDTTFEHGGSALYSGVQVARRCTFRNLEVAIAGGGSLKATLEQCVFTNNVRNWTLGSAGSVGITMIDCVIGPQTAPVEINKGGRPGGWPVYPVYREYTPLFIRVLDPAGQPVQDAIVAVACAADPQAVKNGTVLTDAQGATPAALADGMILVTRTKLQATDVPKAPRSFGFDYQITVAARGYAPLVEHFSSAKFPACPWVVRVEKGSQ